jgi:hypothetical protein
VEDLVIVGLSRCRVARKSGPPCAVEFLSSRVFVSKSHSWLERCLTRFPRVTKAEHPHCPLTLILTLVQITKVARGTVDLAGE